MAPALLPLPRVPCLQPLPQPPGLLPSPQVLLLPAVLRLPQAPQGRRPKPKRWESLWRVGDGREEMLIPKTEVPFTHRHAVALDGTNVRDHHPPERRDAGWGPQRLAPGQPW